MKTFAACFLATAALAASHAAAITYLINPAQAIHQAVKVNVINVADDSGGNAAPGFGTSAQQSAIFGFIDQIWAQAGIDVQFKFRTLSYNSSFALTGTASPRPSTDLNTIVSNAASAGVLDSDPNVLNLFQVRVVPQFPQTGNTTSNGLAFVGGNGITLWTGPTLPMFTDGQQVAAKVLAHEIGHNLGLPHLAETENLMQAQAENPHVRLNASQVATALSSPYSIVLGDTNADDAVGFDDLLTLAKNYNTSGKTYRSGDFDFNGTVDFADLLILAKNYNYSTGSAPGTASLPLTGYSDLDTDGELAVAIVPEPTTLVLVPLALGVIGRRSRR